MLRNFCHWLVKVCQYAVFLWEDRDWDYGFVLRMLQYKLSRTRKCIKANNIISDVDRVVLEILIAEHTIDRIMRDEYMFTPEYEQFEKKWGSLVFDPYMRHQNELTDADRDECRREFKRLADDADKLETADWNYLWLHFWKHMRGWWD